MGGDTCNLQPAHVTNRQLGMKEREAEMKTLFRDLRSIVRLAISQPLLTLAAVLVIAFAFGADTSTFNELDASLSHAVGYSGAVGEPAIVGEVRAKVESVPPAHSCIVPDRAVQPDSTSRAVASTVGVSNSSRQRSRATSGSGIARIANGTWSSAKTNPSESLAIDLGVIPSVAVNEVRSGHGAELQPKRASIPRPLASLIGPSLSRLIADRMSADQTTIEMENSESAIVQRRKARVCADIDAFARRLLARPSPLRMARPASITEGSAGGR
jgi:hypothetical protein